MSVTIKPCRAIDEHTLKTVYCRNWRDCVGHAWYDPADITYCWHQVAWIITELLDYNAGDIVIGRDTWPPEDKETGYQDVPSTTKNTSSFAPYEFVLQYAGEIKVRLKATGADGRYLMLELLNENLYLSQEARNALLYCSGARRKRLSYRQWLANRQYKYRHRVSERQSRR